MISSWTCLPGCVVLHSTGLHQSKKMSIKKKTKTKNKTTKNNNPVFLVLRNDAFFQLLTCYFMLELKSWVI